MAAHIGMIDPAAITRVAQLMARIKPEFWNIDGAARQLREGTGWYLAEEDHSPQGWILCHLRPGYRLVEIECLGYDQGGQLAVGPALAPLLAQCETWGQAQGAVNAVFVIGSRGLSCHGQPIETPGSVLQTLRADHRDEFDWFVSRGYVPSGVLPDAYGTGHHGIVLVKRLE